MLDDDYDVDDFGEDDLLMMIIHEDVCKCISINDDEYMYMKWWSLWWWCFIWTYAFGESYVHVFMSIGVRYFNIQVEIGLIGKITSTSENGTTCI